MSFYTWTGSEWKLGTDFHFWDGAVWRVATDAWVWTGNAWEQFIAGCTSPTFSSTVENTDTGTPCSAGKFNSCCKWTLTGALCTGDYMTVRHNTNGGTWVDDETNYDPETDAGTPCRKLTNDGSYYWNICTVDGNTLNIELKLYNINDTLIDTHTYGFTNP